MSPAPKPKQADIAPLGLRMPEALKERVKAAAEANGRSMNAEIVHTLEEAYPAPVGHAAFFAMFKDMVAMIVRLLEEKGAAPERAALEFALVRNYFDAADAYIDDLKAGTVAGVSAEEAQKILSLWERNSEGIAAARAISRDMAKHMLRESDRSDDDPS